MKMPLDAVDEMALDMPPATDSAAATVVVVMVAVTVMEPAAMERAMSAVSTPAACAKAAT